MGNNWTIASIITDFLDRRKDAEVVIPDTWVSMYKTEYGRYHIQFEDKLSLSWDDRKKFQKFLNKHIACIHPTDDELEKYFDGEEF